MSVDPPKAPTAPLIVLAVVAAAFVHPIPLALASRWPSAALVSLGMIASFFLFDPFLTIPVGVVLRRQRRRGAPRPSLMVWGLLAGGLSGLLVWLSHECVDRLVLDVATPTSDRLAGVVHPVASAGFGAIAAWWAGRANPEPT